MQISCAPWGSDVDIFEENFFAKDESWYQINDLPFHLWNSESLTKISDLIGEAAAIERDKLELQQLDTSRVRSKLSKGIFGFIQ